MVVVHLHDKTDASIRPNKKTSPRPTHTHLLLLLLVEPAVRLGLFVERPDERLVLPAGLRVAELGDLLLTHTHTYESKTKIRIISREGQP